MNGNTVKMLDGVKIVNDIAHINIYGDICNQSWECWDEDVCPFDFSDFLKTVGNKELHIHINSGGGDAFAGVAIYNMLKAREGNTIVHIDALAASSASIIALAGDNVIMPSGAMLMIHRPWTMMCGNAEDLRKGADTLDSICNNMLDIYKDNLVNSNDYGKVKALVEAESWLSGNEASALFKNIVVDDSVKACACIKCESMKHYKLPSNLVVDESKTNVDEEYKRKVVEIESML